MRKLKVLWVAGVGLATIIIAASNLRAAVDEKLNARINSIADMLEKGDTAGAKAAAKAITQEKDYDLELVMYAFKLRQIKGKQVGVGVGTKPGTLKPEQDGIEVKVELIAANGITPDVLKKEAEALARAGQVVAAVSHITSSNPPAKDMGKMTKKAWMEWSEGLTKGGEAFTAAAKAGNVGDLKTAAGKIKQSCDNCHTIFK